jgi:hypothetical protein
MADLIHDDILDWPNGKGYTECTRAYRETKDELDSIIPHGMNLSDLSLDEYERWNRLTDKLADMHLNGHIGISERFPERAA